MPDPMITTPTPDDTEARFPSSAQERLGLDFVEAILSDVYQGKRDHLREHMVGVVAKVARKHPWPYFEECVAEKVTAAQADADALRARVEALIGPDRDGGKVRWAPTQWWDPDASDDYRSNVVRVSDLRAAIAGDQS